MRWLNSAVDGSGKKINIERPIGAMGEQRRIIPNSMIRSTDRKSMTKINLLVSPVAPPSGSDSTLYQKRDDKGSTYEEEEKSNYGITGTPAIFEEETKEQMQ